MLGFSNEIDFPNTYESWESRIHPDDVEKSIEASRKHLLDKTGKTPYDVEYRLLHKSGEYRHFRVTGQFILDKDGKFTRFTGAIMDITEDKNLLLSQEKLRLEAEAANKLKNTTINSMESILNSMDAMTYVTVPDTGEILFVNLEYAAGRKQADKIRAFGG